MRFSIICSSVPYSARVAHHHAAEQILAALGHHQLLVDLLAFVAELIGAAARRLAVRVADARDIHAHQLQLGAHVGAAKPACVAEQLLRNDARHVIARRDEPEHLPFHSAHSPIA